MATKKEARGEAGQKNTSKIEDNKAPPESQDIYTPEEALIGAAVTSWEDVAPLAVTNDLFCDPTLLKTWKALVANPAAGIPGLPKDLKLRALRCIELYNGEDPGAMITLLREAHDKRVLQTIAEKIQKSNSGDTAAAIWAQVSQYREAHTVVASPIETTRYTPDSLAATDFPEPDWLIPSLLPAGITLLAGRSKIGKSWLALQWGAKIRGKVIYATYEDYAPRLKSRTEKLGITGKDLIIIPHPPWQMPQALNELAVDVATYKPSCIIIDPWVLFKPLRRDSSRIYEVDYEAFGQLRTWANEMNVSALIIHHTRKGTPGQRGDPIDEPLGSTALTGASDTVAVLERKNDIEAILKIRGRDIEAKELALNFNNGRWEVLGDARDTNITGARAEALTVLRESEEPLKSADVARILEQDPNSVRVVLNRMYGDHQVTKDKEGRYGVTLVTPVTVEEF